MKTNKLFLSLLCASVAAIFVASCAKTSTEQLPDTHDTTYINITTEMLIPEFGLESADVCQNIGQYSIYFRPNAAWTFTSQTEWLEVVTASGTEADTVLTVNVTQKNDSNDPRTATTTITVGGVAKTLTITQMGNTPSIKVFSRTIEFSTDVTEGWIYNIFTNCEIEVASNPEWVNSTEVIEVQKGYEYKVRLELTPENYDSEDRDGLIVLKDKASSFTTDVRILCSRFSADYYIDKASLEALKDYVIPGDGDDAKRSFDIGINESPDVVSGDVVMKYAFYNYKVTSEGGKEVGAEIMCTVNAMPAPRSVYGKALYNVTVPKYTYSANNEEIRSIGCFIYPEGEELNPQKDIPFLIIKQSLYVDVMQVTEHEAGDILYAPLGAVSTSTVQFKVRTGVVPKIKITDYTAEGFSAPTNGVFPGAATLLSSVASGEEGWELCTYEIQLTDEAKSLDFGTKNSWDDKPIACSFWEHYICLYTTAEYNPAERTGVRFRMEKASPPVIVGYSDVEISSADQAVTDVVVTTFGSDEEPVLTLTKEEAYGLGSDFLGDIQPSPTKEVSGIKTMYTFKLTFAPDEDFTMDSQFGNEYNLNISCAGEEVEVMVKVKY